MNVLHMPLPLLAGQLLLGLINGAFYAVLSLGLAIIFGVLRIANFAHGALYMMGAFGAWMLLNYLGIGYWWALVLSPLAVGAFGIVFERVLLRRVYELDHLYGLLLTLGSALVIQGLFRNFYNSTGLPYRIPALLAGRLNLGFMILPMYRGYVVVAAVIVCLATWVVLEGTKIGAYLRAATENPVMVGAFGINVPRLISFTYALGAALAAFTGVLAAPIYTVSPDMGVDILIVIFAVVVIGGLGSIGGAIVTGFLVGVLEAATRIVYPEASGSVVFAFMAVILLIKPGGLFGHSALMTEAASASESPLGSSGSLPETSGAGGTSALHMAIFAAIGVFLLLAPLFVYPMFVMDVLIFALYANSYALLVGAGRLMSFGHAAYFGVAAYICGYAARTYGLTPELAILAGTAAGGLLGFVFGFLALRRQGIYFAMITLALGQMVYFICLRAPFTGGENGLQSIPRGSLFGLFSLADDTRMYYFVAVLFMAAILLIYRIIYSPFGEVLRAIRGSELRVESLGYKVFRYKLMLYVLATALAGFAGAIKALSLQIATLTDVYYSTSGDAVMMTLLGGIGTIFGPIVGGLAYVAMQTYLAPLGSWVTVTQGLIFVFCVMFFREGIIGRLSRIVRQPL